MEPSQSQVMGYLSRPQTYGPDCARVDRIETHGAVVFMAGGQALKIKRAVRYPYMDFSTLERRRDVLRHELEINRRAAPQIYLDVVAVTAAADGTLALDGAGQPVEWALRMRRFDQADLMSAKAATGPLDRPLIEAIADVIAASHQNAPVAASADGPGRLLRDAAQIETALADAPDAALARRGIHLAEVIRHAMPLVAPLLARRAAAGLVRRCHGDLHLANIVLWQGQPVLFDAIEFDEAVATVDVLYDLAFLVMDLERRGQRAAANAVLAHYLWRTRRDLDLEGLAALPVMLALRAAIRAIVAIQRGEASPGARAEAAAEAARCLQAAEAFLAPAPPRLIAVGGLSGTGKSTIAAALAPLFGAAPGALHLRSDLERKALAGIEPTAHLPADAYGTDTAAAVYATLAGKASRVLRAGHSAVVDAVYARPEEREAIAAVASAAGVPFDGVWLEAPQDVLTQRVASRRNDASDATAAVVATQQSYDIGALTWLRIDATGSPDDCLRTTIARLRATPSHSTALPGEHSETRDLPRC